MGFLDDLQGCVGFDWDRGNSGKNQRKHDVSDSECEQVFFNDPLIGGSDSVHSTGEPRFYVLGRTDAGREVFVVGTIREHRIRVISARDMTERELEVYRS